MVYQIWSNKAHKSIIKDILMVILKVCPLTLELKKKQNKTKPTKNKTTNR